MLSQAEIDALLAGAIEVEQTDKQDSVNLADLMGKDSQSGGAESQVHEASVDQREIRPYNFWSPDRFSKEQMRAIELVHEELGERLTISMPSFLRTNLRPRVVHTEQGRFHDFINGLQPNSMFHLIALAPLPGQIVLTISPEISFVILEQRLGGKTDNSRRNHTLTDIDQSLLQDLVENMLNDVKASWSKVVPIEPKLVDSTVNMHWVQMMVGNERVMTIVYELMIRDVTGTMTFYVPYSMLKPVLSELNPHTIITGRKEQQLDVIARQLNMENLSRVKLTLNVVLGKTHVTMGEIINMVVGDILVLETGVNDTLPVRISNRVRFRGKIGRSGKKLALQLVEFATQEDADERGAK